MGQYYLPMTLTESGEVEHHAYSHEFDAGLKLMEHSWLDNKFVQAFETLLVAEAPRRVVWAGDYADGESDADGAPLKRVRNRADGTQVEYQPNLYGLAEDLEPYRPDVPGFGQRSVYLRESNKTLIEIRNDLVPNALPTIIPRTDAYPFLLNWDRKEYVDKRKVERETTSWVGDADFRIHPLPLLTAEGNGRGGGDFCGPDPQGLVGRWARDHIGLSSTAPSFFGAAEWTEIIFDLHEES